MRETRLVRIALSALLSLSVAAPLWAQTHRVDRIDPEAVGEFPGGRGRNEMIVYTPVYPHPTTGTNVLGSEAVVIDGLVVEVGGNDTPIPDDGWVLSGNGEARQWIVSHLQPGTPVAHDEVTVWVDHTFEPQMRSMRWRLRDVEQRLGELGGTGDGLERAQRLRHVLDQIDDPLPPLAARLANLEEQALALELARIPSPAGEVRAVWHRLLTASPEEIRSEVEAMAAAHINAVFTEVNFGASVAYPDPTGLYPQLAHLEGHDPLALFIEECHAHGIEVHAWVHNFFLGFDRDGTNPPERFAQAHPEWVSVNRRGEDELVPWGYRYLNPAHLGLHDALIEAHAAMAAAYELDGYHYDHIRYCLSLSWESGWDYSEYTRGRVREELGFDPLEITPDADPEQWVRWIDWRQMQVSDYVRRQTEAVRAARPGILISAAVFPDLESAIVEKGQNWAEWVEEGWLDAPMPMIYTPSIAEVEEATAECAEIMPRGGPVVMGLGPFLGFSPRLVVEQIVASRRAGATGQCHFVWHRLSEPVREALIAGPWRSTGPAEWAREN